MIRSGLRRLARLALVPLTRPVMARVMARVDRHVQPIRDDVETLTKHLPVLLDTISSQNAAAREARRDQLRLEGEVLALRQRVEELEGRRPQAPQAVDVSTSGR